MPDGDNTLAQIVYLANNFAQRGTCQCQACQLLRKATDMMTAQVLGAANFGPGQNSLADVAKVLGAQPETREGQP
jgi:microcystin-dependent protein